jgi:hypothetical protein
MLESWCKTEKERQKEVGRERNKEEERGIELK